MGLIIALGSYMSAVVLMFGSLYLERRQRTGLIPVIWALLGLSLWNHSILPSAYDFRRQVGMTIVITILHCPTMLASTTKPLNVSRPGRDLPTAYKLFNNPRALRESVFRIEDSSSHKHWKFISTSCLKGLSVLIARFTFQYMDEHVTSTFRPWDFKPKKECIFTLIATKSLTMHDLLVRAWVSLAWIYQTYFNLTIAHLLLGIFFVAVLRVDHPTEWPPLFNSYQNAYTLRRFWSKFWHQLFTPSARRWANFITSHSLFLQQRPRLRKIFVAFTIFNLSALAHMAIGWTLGDVALRRELYWAWAHCVGIGGEIALGALIRRSGSTIFLFERRTGWWGFLLEIVRRCLGFMWVLIFFMITMPYLAYPRIYHDLRSQLGILGLFM